MQNRKVPQGILHPCLLPLWDTQSLSYSCPDLLILVMMKSAPKVVTKAPDSEPAVEGRGIPITGILYICPISISVRGFRGLSQLLTAHEIASPALQMRMLMGNTHCICRISVTGEMIMRKCGYPFGKKNNKAISSPHPSYQNKFHVDHNNSAKKLRLKSL